MKHWNNQITKTCVAFLWSNFNFCSDLVELHETKNGSILKILPWRLKFMWVYKLVVIKTSNGFVIFILIKLFRILHLKSHYFSSNRHWRGAVVCPACFWRSGAAVATTEQLLIEKFNKNSRIQNKSERFLVQNNMLYK